MTVPPTLLAAETVRPTEAAINDQIRTLMNHPASAERTEEYVRLLTLWARAGTVVAGRCGELGGH